MNPQRVAAALHALAEAIADDERIPAKVLTTATPPSPPSEPPQEILTREDAAALLRMTPKQVVNLVKTRGLPGKKISRGWRFYRSDVMTWLARQEAH